MQKMKPLRVDIQEIGRAFFGKQGKPNMNGIGILRNKVDDICMASGKPCSIRMESGVERNYPFGINAFRGHLNVFMGGRKFATVAVNDDLVRVSGHWSKKSTGCGCFYSVSEMQEVLGSMFAGLGKLAGVPVKINVGGTAVRPSPDFDLKSHALRLD